eukprot:1887555-Pyramimonas_sp.AAC.2
MSSGSALGSAPVPEKASAKETEVSPGPTTDWNLGAAGSVMSNTVITLVRSHETNAMVRPSDSVATCTTDLSVILVQAPELTAKKAFDFNSTVNSRRLSTLVYHSAHDISNIPRNIVRIFPADGLPLAGRQSTPGLDAHLDALRLCALVIRAAVVAILEVLTEVILVHFRVEHLWEVGHVKLLDQVAAGMTPLQQHMLVARIRTGLLLSVCA